MSWDRYSEFDVLDNYACGATNLLQFQFVTVNASNQLVMPSAGALCMVLYDAPPMSGAYPQSPSGASIVGTYYTCVFNGIAKVIAGAALNAFVPVTTNSSGQAVGSPSTGQFTAGVTMHPCASGDLVSVKLTFGDIHY